VNVLAVAGAPSVGELAEAGVSRVSVGGAFAFAALGALVDAATELRDQGTYGYLAGSAAGRRAIKDAVLAAGHGTLIGRGRQAVGPLPSQPRRLNRRSRSTIATTSEPMPRTRK
jgi:hypothetical protein